VDVSSITSPELGAKKLYLDPNLVSLVRGKRVFIIDDAVSSGKTLNAAWDLLERIGCVIEGCGVAMMQGEEWRELLKEDRARNVVGVMKSPMLKAVENGWDMR
jgi:adenine/guanine phosphoribosyltransferase-like PRPP-binding protein